MKDRRPALSVREDLAAIAPYVSPQHPARYRMNTNESPYPPPEELVREVTRALEGASLNRYPDRDATSLFNAISAYVGWPAEGLWVANGSNEVFLHLFLGFGGPGRKALVFEPTYSLHSLIPRITGTEVVSADRAGDFSVDPGRAAEAVDRNTPDLVIFCSPNNPTGAVERRDAIEAVLDVAPGLVVVDEAYAEFGEPEESVRDLLDTRSNLVLTKTFSKAWRLAGVRIGYMLGDPALIAELARVRLPYHLSTLTQAVGEAALKHAGATLELVNSIKHERERIGKGLEALDLRAWPSSANFVLFEVDEPERVFNGLLEREVLVRRYGSVPQLERCLRVTAGLPEETDAFLAALEEVCRG